jgi:hypothetical protein
MKSKGRMSLNFMGDGFDLEGAKVLKRDFVPMFKCPIFDCSL